MDIPIHLFQTRVDAATVAAKSNTSLQHKNEPKVLKVTFLRSRPSSQVSFGLVLVLYPISESLIYCLPIQ